MDGPGSMLLAYEKKQQNRFLRELLDRIGHVESQVAFKGSSNANLATKSDFEYLTRRVKASEESLAQMRTAFEQLPNFYARLEDMSNQARMLGQQIRGLHPRNPDIALVQSLMPQVVEVFLKSDVIRKELNGQLQTLACRLNERLAACEGNRRVDLARLDWVVEGVQVLARSHDKYARSVDNAGRCIEQLSGQGQTSRRTPSRRNVQTRNNENPAGSSGENDNPSAAVPGLVPEPPLTGATGSGAHAGISQVMRNAIAVPGTENIGQALQPAEISTTVSDVQPRDKSRKRTNRGPAPPANRANAPKPTVTTRAGRAAQARRRHRQVEALHELDSSGNPRIYVEHKAESKRERSVSVAPAYIVIKDSPAPAVEVTTGGLTTTEVTPIEEATTENQATKPVSQKTTSGSTKASNSRKRKR